MSGDDTRIKVALFHHDNTVTVSIRLALADEHDFTLSSYDNALIGLAALTRNPPDVVLAAADLPIIDGFQLLRLMRSPEYPTLGQIPVVMIGRESITSASRAKESGACDLLTWPFNNTVLTFALRRARQAVQSEPTRSLVLVLSGKSEVVDRVDKCLEQEAELEVKNARSPDELMKHAAAAMVEMAIVDNADPELTLETLKKMAAGFPEIPRIPVIVAQTGPPDPKATRTYLDLGAADVVPAVSKRGELEEACHHHLRRWRSQRSSPHGREDIVEHVFDSACVPILVIEDKSMRIHAANDAAAHLLGRTRHDLERSTLVQSLSGAHREAAAAAVHSAMENGAAQADLPASDGRNPALRAQVTRLEWSDLLMVVLAQQSD